MLKLRRRESRVLMLSVGVLLICAGCGSEDTDDPVDAGVTDDGSADDGSADDGSEDVGSTADGSIDDGSTADGGGDAFPRPIEFPGIAENGVFDPSIAADPSASRIWMSYSTVDCIPPDFCVGTRLAYSDDQGEQWHEAGLVINAYEDEPSPPVQHSGQPASWEHEVSNLVFDPAAPEGERWKLLWHRYLKVVDGDSQTDDRKFAFGWLSLKAASSPEELVDAPERKLFAAAGYDIATTVTTYNDGFIGPPEVRLASLDPALADCVVATEPGMFASEDTLYVSMLCLRDDADNPADIELLAWPYPNGPWEYRGTPLVSADANALDPAYSFYTAADLFDVDGTWYLLATPYDGNGARLSGCVGFTLDRFFRDGSA